MLSAYRETGHAPTWTGATGTPSPNPHEHDAPVQAARCGRGATECTSPLSPTPPRPHSQGGSRLDTIRKLQSRAPAPDTLAPNGSSGPQASQTHQMTPPTTSTHPSRRPSVPPPSATAELTGDDKGTGRVIRMAPTHTRDQRRRGPKLRRAPRPGQVQPLAARAQADLSPTRRMR